MAYWSIEGLQIPESIIKVLVELENKGYDNI